MKLRMQVVIFIDDSDDDCDVRASCVILRSSGSGNSDTGGRPFQIQVAYIDTCVV